MSIHRGQQPASLEYSTIQEFLNLRWKPGRSCSWQAAAILGVETQHIPILIGTRLLKPLGNPPANAPKYFFTKYLLRLAEDERWLERVSDALVEHWASRNAKKRKPGRKSGRVNATLN